MPISIAPLNQELTIIRVSNDPKVKKHLESLGIVINSKITILSSHHGNVIIALKEGRLALDRNIANSIFVC